MNYLAHIHLSFDNHALAVGNFITDLLRPEEKNNFSEEIQQGIALHYFIDRKTDAHRLFKETKKLFVPRFRHYASVVVDIVYDHFLAKNFKRYHALSLEEFTAWFYQSMEAQEIVFSDRIKYVYAKLKQDNWFNAYLTLEGLSQVFKGMDNRTFFRSGMREAPLVLAENYEKIGTQFEVFYADMMEIVQRKLRG